MNIQEIMKYDYNFVITIVLFTSGFFYALLTSMIFFKEVKKVAIFLALCIGYYYEEINLYIFSFYSEINSNPQVSTVIYMLASTIILTALLAIKSFRSRERAIITITSWAVIIAWFFIHYALIVNQLVFIENKLFEVRKEAVIPYVANNDKEGFIDFCSFKKYDCLILTTKMELIDKTKKTSKAEVSNALKSIHPIKTSSVEYSGKSYRMASGKNLFFNESAISVLTIINKKKCIYYL